MNWLQTELLRKADFWEDRQGNCRICSPLVITLCETSATWRRLLAPVAEWEAQALWNTPRAVSKRHLVPTRLTQRRRSEGRRRKFVPLTVPLPRPRKICEVCGAEGVKNRYCRSCRVEASRETMAQVALIGHSKPKTAKARARISQTLSDHAVANSWWSPSSLPAWLNEEYYAQKIQPQLRTVKAREIAEATHVSQAYAAFIRSGRRAARIRGIGRRWRSLWLISRATQHVIETHKVDQPFWVSFSPALRVGLIGVHSGQESRTAPDRELEERVYSCRQAEGAASSLHGSHKIITPSLALSRRAA